MKSVLKSGITCQCYTTDMISSHLTTINSQLSIHSQLIRSKIKSKFDQISMFFCFVYYNQPVNVEQDFYFSILDKNH